VLTCADTTIYGGGERLYTEAVRGFTVGDVIRKARADRRWKQERLGAEAALFPLGRLTGAINKSTVSKVERDPYGSKFGTVWRLLAALNLTLADAESAIGALPRQEGTPRRTLSAGGRR
jgi:transcriptional regulator with XRE-family HTH domain